MSHEVSSRSAAKSAGGMLKDVATHIREQAAAYCESSKVPGYLAGVYHDGDQIALHMGWRMLSRGRQCVTTLDSFLDP
jgi:hypothetical protein